MGKHGKSPLYLRTSVGHCAARLAGIRGSTMGSITTMPTASAAYIEPAIAGHDNPFMVASHLEITHILHAILREATLITVTLDVNDFFLTSLLVIDEHTNCMLLERGRGRPHLSNALKSRRLSYSTTLDKVQIRFTCEGIEATTYDGVEVYKVPLPTELLRIQRREYYRVPTPIVAPVKCRISNAENTGDGSVELNLCDISCGGIAVRSQPAIFTPVLGERYSCTIHLLATTGLQVMTQARNAFMVTLLNGKIIQRSGFAFVDPPEQILTTIQRYILNLERQHRTRSGRSL
ncbi:MAG: flagellar brake protein [Burkholderiales bacterium]